MSVDQDEQINRALSRVGKVLKSKFRLDTLLGVGGMASVYAATHRNQKRVAVKLLHPELSSDVEMKTRFLREGYAANKIGHPGAVSVLDDDISEEGAAFLVMELLDGETLEQLWDRVGPRVNPFEVLEYLDQVLDTLAAAHDKGIVHRDIKPENLFLTTEGRVKILDFGIARVREQGTALKAKMTTAGTVMGTPAFMAPEQARARWSDVDGRTDLWALAATAHMLLTGRCVHEAPNGNEQLIMSATRIAPSIATIDPSLPPQVITIIDRGLNYKMDRRWPNARAMQIAVRAAKENRAVQDPYAGEVSRVSQSDMQAVSSGSGRPSGHPQSHPSGRPSGIPSRPDVSASGQMETDLSVAFGELEQRLRLVRQRVAEAQAQLSAAKAEREKLEGTIEVHVGNRGVAVEEARERVRSQLITFARAVVGDTANFPVEFAVQRQQIGALQAVLETRTNAVNVAKRAMISYDAEALKRGYIATAVISGILLLCLFAPVIRRFFFNN
jgi:serine/threonine protein kinase